MGTTSHNTSSLFNITIDVSHTKVFLKAFKIRIHDGALCIDWERRSFIGATKFGVEARLITLEKWNGLVEMKF